MPSGVLLGAVFVLDAMAAARLAQVLAQQLAVSGIQQPHLPGIPLHLDAPADPARRRAVVGGFDFHAAVQMHGALAVLVVAEGLERQRQQRRPLFGEHGGDLPLGGAVDARVGPALFPVIQVGLGLPPGFRSAGPSAASSWHGRHRSRPFLFDPDRRRGRAEATAP